MEISLEAIRTALSPMAVVGFGALFILLLDLFREKDSAPMAGVIRLLLPLAVCVCAWILSIPFNSNIGVIAGTLLYADTFSFIFNSMLLLGTGLSILLCHENMKVQGVKPSIDIDILMLLTLLGGMVMVSASNLILLFIGFELLSVSVYALTGLARTEKASAEGALKYFLLGAFSSAFLLYGMTLVYGATGSMELAEIAAGANADNPLLLVGVGLMLFGFGFKVSLVPFHFWTPDVYQGAPVSIAGFMAVVVKAAAFGSFLRVMYVAFGGSSEVWTYAFWMLAALTMCIGNLVALRQNSVKRMLAYSSIAHAGYALIGFISGQKGAEATVFYLFVYGFMTMAAFGVVLLVTKDSDAQYNRDNIESFSGIGWTHPFLALVMSVALLSLAGVPPLAGFIGKFYLFSAGIEAGHVGLVIIAAVNSVLSFYYYLRLLVVMYFREETRSVSWMPSNDLSPASVVALSISTVGIVYFGIFSSGCYQVVRAALASLS